MCVSWHGGFLPQVRVATHKLSFFNLLFSVCVCRAFAVQTGQMWSYNEKVDMLVQLFYHSMHLCNCSIFM